jgi:hypothetical protein
MTSSQVRHLFCIFLVLIGLSLDAQCAVERRQTDDQQPGKGCAPALCSGFWDQVLLVSLCAPLLAPTRHSHICLRVIHITGYSPVTLCGLFSLLCCLLPTLQVVELQLLLCELDMLPLHTTGFGYQLTKASQQLLATLAAAAPSSSSSDSSSGWRQHLGAAIQASYQANKTARQHASQMARRPPTQQQQQQQSAAGSNQATAAAAAAGVSRPAANGSRMGAVAVAAALGSSSSSRFSRGSSSAAAAATAAASQGFYYPSNRWLLELQLLQQQRRALLWATTRFRVLGPLTEPWMASCLSVFQGVIPLLPPAVAVGLLEAAAEARVVGAAAAAAAAGTPSSSSSSDAYAELLLSRRVLHSLGAKLSHRVLALSSGLRRESLVQALAALSAYGARFEPWTSQSTFSATSARVFRLTDRQRQLLLTSALRQLPYVPRQQLTVLTSAVAKLGLNPSPSWLAAACQVLAARAVAESGSQQPAQQLLLLAAARQLLLSGSSSRRSSTSSGRVVEGGSKLGSTGVPKVGMLQDLLRSFTSAKTAVAKATGAPADTAAAAYTPVAAAAEGQAGLAGAVSRVMGAATLQLLSDMMHRQQQRQGGSDVTQTSKSSHNLASATPAATAAIARDGVPVCSTSPVATLLSGCAAQLSSLSADASATAAAVISAEAAAAAVAGSEGVVLHQQQQQLAALAVVLNLAGTSSNSSNAEPAQNRQPREDHQQQQQQLLSKMLRVELQQAVTAVSAAAAAAAAASTPTPLTSTPSTSHNADISGPHQPEMQTPLQPVQQQEQQQQQQQQQLPVPHRLAARGLQLRFDGLLRWAFLAATGAKGKQTQQQQQEPEQQPSADALAHQTVYQLAQEAADGDAPAPSSSSSSGGEASAVELQPALISSEEQQQQQGDDGTVLVLPVMSRALDVQFARLLHKVLMGAAGSSRSSSR